ncbi:MAG: hypothetical protein E6J90_47695 [Deltaproteobacteria bacterium]|nr:MAG: hypothetical protein E6J90_47695 [Deltaproteobacteria bacterium]
MFTPASAATGLIFAAAAKDMKVTDTFTVRDGATMKTFGFTTNTNNTDPLKIIFDPMDATDTNNQMAIKIGVAISASGLHILAAQLGVTGIVNLTHTLATSQGDLDIADNVSTSNFAVFGMTGGHAGDCGAGVGCMQNNDCASHVCKVDHTCQ